MNLKWNEVTWYSKLGALILFLIVVPILAFVTGIKYQEVKELRVQTAPATIQKKASYDASFTYGTTTASTTAEDFSISYPIISLPENKPIEDKINSNIQSALQNTLSNYEASALPCNIAGRVCKVTVDITSTTTTSSKFNTASIEFDAFINSEQMAHPDFERTIAQTYDLSTGEEKPYYEVLGLDQTSAFDKLSALSRTDLKEKFGKDLDSGDEVFLKGTDPTAENFSFVLLGDDALTVNFSYYQIGSRPFGSPTILINYDELGL